jgi:hypothetical protein
MGHAAKPPRRCSSCYANYDRIYLHARAAPALRILPMYASGCKCRAAGCCDPFFSATRKRAAPAWRRRSNAWATTSTRSDAPAEQRGERGTLHARVFAINESDAAGREVSRPAAVCAIARQFSAQYDTRVVTLGARDHATGPDAAALEVDSV